MIADPELYKLFKAESDEHLSRLDDGLLRLEKSPTDSSLLEEVFRESHSLKGAARMLGLSRIETAAHGMEGIFNAARKGETPLSPEIITQMNACLADLRRRVAEALSADSNADTGSKITAPAKIDAEQKPTIALPPQANADLESTRPNPTISHVQTPEPPPSPPFIIDSVRVETRKLDELLTQVGELSVIQGRGQHRLSLMDELLEQWAMLERDSHRLAPSASALNNPIKEARLGFGHLLKQARDTFFDDYASLESIVQRLEDQVTGMRLLPLTNLFALFPRMVHDLAKEQGKEVELILEGGDITVDKRILEEMKDPLMHLLRNAIDHGIEIPEQRLQLGKPRLAAVKMRAERKDDGVLLEVLDDGRGLDLSSIRQEAIKRCLVDEMALAVMTPQQLQQLIFNSGFSTSRYVTELSGRGVGLDVVRANVERLKGAIRLESLWGQGLTVKIHLPLNLATTKVLLANVNGRLFGLQVEFIHTSRWIKPQDIFMLDGHPSVYLDGEPILIARLEELLELPTTSKGSRLSTPTTECKTLACVVIQVDHGRFGLLADDLPGEEEVVTKPLGPPLKRVRNVSSLTMLGNGSICPVLSPADLLISAKRLMRIGKLGSRNLEAIPKALLDVPETKPAVLLVEDSALIRAMEKRILEDANYEVVTAVDGLDGLNLLGSRAFAAVITDIMMPNMDGLTLTAHIRATPGYHNLPVILVTSLASDEDKRRGLDAGANAYIPKPTFDQRLLLDTLKRLVSL